MNKYTRNILFSAFLFPLILLGAFQTQTAQGGLPIFFCDFDAIRCNPDFDSPNVVLDLDVECLEDVPVETNINTVFTNVPSTCTNLTLSMVEDIRTFDIAGTECSLSVTRTYSLTDGTNTVECIQEFDVRGGLSPIPGVSPSLIQPSNLVFTCEEQEDFVLVPFDPADPFFGVVTNITLPTPTVLFGCPSNEVTFSDQLTAVCSGAMLLERTWQVEDNCGFLSPPVVQRIEIVPTDPIISLPFTNITVNPGDPIDPATLGGATATNGCGAIPTFTDTPITVPGCDAAIQRVWTASNCLISVSATQTVCILPPPCDFASIECNLVWDGYIPGVIDVDCLGDVPVETNLTVLFENIPTNCTLSLIVEETISTNEADFSGECTLSVSRMYILSDGIDTLKCVQEYEVRGLLTLIGAEPGLRQPTNLVFICDEREDFVLVPFDAADPTLGIVTNLTLAPPEAVVACPDNEITFSDRLTVTCPGVMRVERSWQIESYCGNLSPPVVQTIDLVATEPTLTLPFLSTNLPCGAASDPATLGVATITNTCPDFPPPTHADTFTTNDCLLSIDRVWTSSNCATTVSATQQIFIALDDTPPEFIGLTNVTIDCTDDPADSSVAPTPLLTDNCNASNLSVTVVDSTIAGLDCLTEIIRVFTAADACNNMSTATQVITIVDNSPPTFDAPPTNLVFLCEDVPESFPSPSNVTDNCGTVTTNPISSLQLDGCRTLIGRSWSFTDDCGNESRFEQSITIIEFDGDISTPELLMADCAASLDPADIGGTPTANCSVDFTYADTLIAERCDPGSLIERVWTGLDPCGNVWLSTQFINLVDSTAPTFSVPADMNLACGSNVSNQPGNLLDDCSTNIQYTSTEDMIPGDCIGSHTLIRVWTVTDGCNETSATQTITFADTEPPTFTSVPSNRVVECGESSEPLALAIATDRCSTAEIFYADLELVGDCPGTRVIERLWTAMDACGNSTQRIQTLTINDTIAPGFTVPPDLTVTNFEEATPENAGAPTDVLDLCSTPNVTFSDETNETLCANTIIIRTWTVADACDNIRTAATQSIVVTANRPPSFLPPADLALGCTDATDLDTTGRPTDLQSACTNAPDVAFADQVQTNCPGSVVIRRTWTATDCCGAISSAVQVITILDVTPPSFNPPRDFAFENCGDTGPLVTSFPAPTDICDPDPTIDFQDTITPSFCEHQFTITRTWTVADACGNSSQSVQTITVTDLTPPTIDLPSNLVVSCTDDVPAASNLFATATDNCDPAPTLEASDTIEPGDCPGNVTILRAWTATDACLNSASATQIITVIDQTPPTFTAPADVTLPCGAEPPTDMPTDLADECAGVPGFTTAELEGAAQPDDCPNTQVLLRVFTATDACGNTLTLTQTVTFADITPPVLQLTNVVTLGCIDEIPAASPADVLVTDDCDLMPTLTFTDTATADLTPPSPCPDGTLLTRVWTATDACGNSTSATQSFQRVDTTPPAFETPVDIQIDCNEPIPPAVPPALFDICDPTPTATLTELRSPGACPGSEVISRVWTISDACNNIAVHTQTITRIDTTPPVLSSLEDLSLDCDGNLAPGSIERPTVVDTCDTAPVLTFVVEAPDVECPGLGTVTRIWTATDACGNSTQAVQLIRQVTPTPTLVLEEDTVILPCGADTDPASVGFATLTNTCAFVPPPTYTDAVFTDECFRVTTRIWTTATCDSSVSATQRIVLTINDTPPRFEGPTNFTFECSQYDPATIPPLTLVDPCIGLAPDPELFITSRSAECPALGEILRIWSFTNLCGIVATATQVITIIDAEGPTFVAPPSRFDFFCESTPESQIPGPSNVSDDCASVPGIPTTLTESLALPGVIADGCIVAYNRTWTFEDACGNETQFIQTISIYTTTGIDFDAPDLLLAECGDSLDPADLGGAPTGLVSTTNCDIVFNYEDTNIAPPPEPGPHIERIWTGENPCGNQWVITQFIEFVDSAPPTLACPAAQTLNGGQLPDCSATLPDLTTGITIQPGDMIEQNPPAGTVLDTPTTLPVTITLTDTCGNQTQCTTQVTLECDEPIAPTPRLELAKTLVSQTETSPDTIRLLYTLTLVNPGAISLSQLRLEDDITTIFNGATFFSPQAISGTLAASPDWRGGDENVLAAGQILLPGQTGTVQIAFSPQLASPGGFPLVNTATATAVGNSTPVSATASAAPVALPPGPEDTPRVDLAITKTVDRTTATVGDFVTFSLSIETDDDPALVRQVEEVIVEDLLPSGLTYVGHVGTNYDPTSGQWTIINYQGIALLSITARVDRAGLLTNTARIVRSGPTIDENPVNDIASAAFASQAFLLPPPLEETFTLEGVVWEDRNRDRGTENENLDLLGIPGIRVILEEIDEDLNFIGTEATTITGPRGAYRFTGLRRGTYRLSVDPNTLPDRLKFATTGLEQRITLTGDRTDVDNFGLTDTPTAIGLSSITATRVAEGVLFEWTVAWEQDTLGYHVTRDGVPVHDVLILAGSSEYELFVPGAKGGTFTLVELTTDLATHPAASILTTADAAPTADQPTDILDLADGLPVELSPTAGRNLLLTGTADATILDLSDPGEPVQLIPTSLEHDGDAALYLDPGTATTLKIE